MEKLKYRPSNKKEIINLKEQPKNQKIVEYILSDLNYTNALVQEVNSGDVHYVFRIESPEQNSCYIKIRREHFKSNTQIYINPKDIQIEKNSINYLNDCFPGVAPKILGFYEEYSAICLEDVAEEKTTVEDLIMESCSEDYDNLGVFLGKLHKSFLKHEYKIRGENEESFYKDSLYYRLGFLNIPKVDELISNLYKLPKQNIHGDLTPWNIVWGKKNNCFRLYDLETVHNGNRIFDLAFLEAHIILEMFSQQELFFKLLSSFKRGYESNFPDTDENLEIRLAFALTLLRLKGNSTYKTRNQFDSNNLEEYAQNIIIESKKSILKWSSLPTFD